MPSFYNLLKRKVWSTAENHKEWEKLKDLFVYTKKSDAQLWRSLEKSLQNFQNYHLSSRSSVVSCASLNQETPSDSSSSPPVNSLNTPPVQQKQQQVTTQTQASLLEKSEYFKQILVPHPNLQEGQKPKIQTSLLQNAGRSVGVSGVSSVFAQDSPFHSAGHSITQQGFFEPQKRTQLGHLYPLADSQRSKKSSSSNFSSAPSYKTLQAGSLASLGKTILDIQEKIHSQNQNIKQSQKALQTILRKKEPFVAVRPPLF